MLGYLADIDAVRAFIELSDQGVTRNEFTHFTRRVLQEQAAIVSMSWLPRITHDQRAEHEREAAADGLENYGIKAETSDGNIVVSPVRDEYFPLYFRLEKDSVTGSAGYGMDQRYIGTVGRSLERARMSGRLVVSEDIKLRRGGWGLFASLPVLQRQSAPRDD